MNHQIIGLAPGLDPALEKWLDPIHQHPTGQAVRIWAQKQYDQAVQDIFGYHALQLGACHIETLAHSRIAHRWVATDDATSKSINLLASASALPYFEATLDLVTLPFTLDAHSDPDAVLDEVARVLVPEGHAIFVGFDLASVWGIAHQLGSRRLPKGIQMYGLSHLKESLTELGLVVESVQYRQRRVDGLYFLIAKKRVMVVRPLRRKAWRLPRLADWSLNPLPNPKPNLKPGIKPKNNPSQPVHPSPPM